MYLNFSNFRGQTLAGGQALVQMGGGIDKIFAGWEVPPGKNPWLCLHGHVLLMNLLTRDELITNWTTLSTLWQTGTTLLSPLYQSGDQRDIVFAHTSSWDFPANHRGCTTLNPPHLVQPLVVSVKIMPVQNISASWGNKSWVRVKN